MFISLDQVVINEVIDFVPIADNNNPSRGCLERDADMVPSPWRPVRLVELTLVEDPEKLAQPICSRTVINLEDVYILQIILTLRLTRRKVRGYKVPIGNGKLEKPPARGDAGK